MKIGALGILGLGVILSNGVEPSPGHTSHDIVAVFAGEETTAGCTETGCIKVKAGATEDGTIFSSGAGLRVGNLDQTAKFEVTSTGSIVKGVWNATQIAASYITGLFTQTSADERYVKKAGDTMTGALTVKAALSGATLTAAGGRFGVTSSGNTIFNNQRYAWPAKAGSGKFLKTDSGGTLTWAAAGGGATTDDWDVKNTSTSAGSECGVSSSAEVDCAPNYTITAGDWATVGDVYVVEVFGRMKVAADTLTMQMKIGSTDLCTFTMSSGGTTNGPEFHIRALLNLRSAGAGGTMSAHCTFNGASPTGTTLQGDGAESFSVNTTTTNVLQMSADYGGSSASNGMTVLNFVVYKISNPS